MLTFKYSIKLIYKMILEEIMDENFNNQQNN